MNKKMIFGIITLTVVCFLAFGFFQASKLKTIKIQKSVTIEGDEIQIFDMVRYLKNFPKWSPFYVQDPTQQIEVKGTDGTVGAQYHWVGNGGNDVGYQEIKKITPLKYIHMECDIQKPFVAKPVFEYHFSRQGKGVTVTQDFSLESGLVDAFFMWLFGAKAEMEKTNQQGMDLLKKVIEQHPIDALVQF